MRFFLFFLSVGLDHLVECERVHLGLGKEHLTIHALIEQECLRFRKRKPLRLLHTEQSLQHLY
jgi:hypothetical protein